MPSGARSTPMLDQYARLKAEQPGAILLYRLGDFYELFYEDAEFVAPLLDLQLTSRDGRVAMCGVPHHAVEQYTKKLLDRGLTVAIAEQMEDPSQSRGLVAREVVRVLTPGTYIPDDAAEVPRVACLWSDSQGWSLAVGELSTGVVHLIEGLPKKASYQRLRQWWDTWNPQEYLTNHPDLLPDVTTWVDLPVSWRKVSAKSWEREVAESLGQVTLRSYGLDENSGRAMAALGILWRYLSSRQRRAPAHLSQIRRYPLQDTLEVSSRALRQLDAVGNQPDLLHHLDHTMTAMGRRLLRDWMEHPLTKLETILERQQAVERLREDGELRETLQQHLAGVGDISRRVARLASGVGRPRDLFGVREALRRMPPLVNLVRTSSLWPLGPLEAEDWLKMAAEFEPLASPPPARWDDSPLVQAGIDQEIDQATSLLDSQRQALLTLEAQERERSEIKSLRVGYHRTYGYYLEVTKSQASRVPDDWQRRQSTTHTERFVSDPLKALETAMMTAEARVRERERWWSEELLRRLTVSAGRMIRAAETLATIDVLASLAEAAVLGRYGKPEFLSDVDGDPHIVGLQHPVMSTLVDEYVPSELKLPSPVRAAIITGPNMGGKSTFMRSVALNVIMAQMGGMVAAEVYRMPIFGSLWTRIGADDDLFRGQSTFMVEMEEVSAIVRQADAESLVILDELGRGTSTFDGMAIARAVIEHLARPEGPMTLFATHFHELTQLPEIHSRITNLHVEVVDQGRQVTFSHRVIDGPSSRSYGIEVARLSGLPAPLLATAQGYLKELELKGHQAPVQGGDQITLFEPDAVLERLRQAISDLDPDEVSPREAWQFLQNWHDRLWLRKDGS